MRRFLAVVVVGSAVLGGMVSDPAWAGSGSASTVDGSVTYTIPNAFLDGPGETIVPVHVTYTLPNAASPLAPILEVVIEATSPGSEDTLEFDSLDDENGLTIGTLVDLDGDDGFAITGLGSGARTSTFTVTGRMELDVFSGATEEHTTTPLSSSTFTVTRSRTHLARVRAYRDSRYALPTRISAYASAVNSMGKKITVDDSIVVQAQKPGMRRWAELTVGSYVDDFGKFTAAYEALPKGTKIRVSVRDCGWCTDASTQVTLH